jgi:hypothetical protein
MKTTGLLSALVVPVLPVVASADILSSFDRYLGSSRPDYNPEELEARQVDSGRDFAPFSPGDSDLGVQEILGEYKGLPPVRFDVSTGVYWTDNAPGAIRSLDDTSALWTARAAVSWQPRIAAGWFADLGLEGQIFRFDERYATDFENTLVYAGAVKILPELDDLLVYGRLEYQWLTYESHTPFFPFSVDDDYTTARIRVGAQKVLLNIPHHQLAAGISGAFDLDTDPSNLERNEYALDVHYTWLIMDRLSARLSWRGAIWDFDSPAGFGPFAKDREDFNQVAGLELTYQVCKELRIYTSVFFSDSDSNTPLGANDSSAWTSGLGVGATFQF